MKKIKKLALSSSQCLSPDEQMRVLGGGHELKGHSWNCGCTAAGNTCEETWTYDWSFDLEKAAGGGITGYGAKGCSNPYAAAFMLFYSAYEIVTAYESGYTLYTVHQCTGVKNGNKSHTVLYSGIR